MSAALLLRSAPAIADKLQRRIRARWCQLPHQALQMPIRELPHQPFDQLLSLLGPFQIGGKFSRVVLQNTVQQFLVQLVIRDIRVPM